MSAKTTQTKAAKYIMSPEDRGKCDEYAECSRYVRYSLRTAGKNPLVFLCINPSTATEKTSDPTIRKVEEIISKLNEHDSWVMLNIYPQRAAHAEDLDDFDGTIHDKNIRAIEKVIEEAIKADYPLVAAWGDSIGKKDYLIDCLKSIVLKITEIEKKNGKKIKWRSFGRTKDKGNPRHPFSLRTVEALETALKAFAETEKTPFAIDDYIQKYDKQFGGVR